MRLQTPISPLSTVSVDCARSAAFDWAYSTRQPHGRSSLRRIYPTTHLAPPRLHLHRSSSLTPFSACVQLSDLPLPDADPARSVHGDGFSLPAVVLCSSRRRRTGRLKPCMSANNPTSHIPARCAARSPAKASSARPAGTGLEVPQHGQHGRVRGSGWGVLGIRAGDGVSMGTREMKGEIAAPARAWKREAGGRELA